MDLQKNLTPALLAYDGIQYTYMAPAVFEDGQGINVYVIDKVDSDHYVVDISDKAI